LAVLIEIMARWNRFARYKPLLPLVWLLSLISAVVAVLLGYFLSLGGGYNADTLYWHRFGGFAIIGLSLVCYLLHIYPLPLLKKAGKPVYYCFVLVTVIALVVTGHLGGSLTHGEAYLTEYAPTGKTSNGPEKRKITSLDSADIFQDAVMPIIQSKCASCHNKEKKKGELLLTSYDEIFAGGKSGQGFTPGNLATSEIFRRITLPQDHKEFMPGGGKKPLTEAQVAILEWWIETGAQQKAIISNLHPSKKMQEILVDFFQIGRDEILDLTAPPAPPEAITTLIKDGFLVNQLTQKSNLYEIKWAGIEGKPVNTADLVLLKNQLVWLQLPNAGITDEDLKVIGSLPNLYKLNLNRNKITDKGISYLLGLSKLEYLNLYGTGITDSSIKALMEMPNLKKLHVWETAIDTLKMDTLKISRKNLEIVYKLK
jgi:hypothetical protein